MKVSQPKLRDVSELTLNEQNPRQIDPERFDQLVASLDRDPELLEARPIIIDEKGVVLAGNMRLSAAIKLGWRGIWTSTVTDLSEEDRLRLVTLDNAHYGTWDPDKLSELLYEASQDIDLSLTGLPGEEIEEILKDAAAGHATDFLSDLLPQADNHGRDSGSTTVEIGGVEYFKFTMNLTAEQREHMFAAIALAKKNGAETTPAALVQVCDEYVSQEPK